MPPKVRLYSLPISHYCVSAERMLAFKGVPTEIVPAAYHTRQELLRRTGQDYVPTLLWGRRTVLWHEIPEFLDRVRPEPSLHPAGQEALARAIENWGHQVVEERVWRVVVTEVPPVLSSDDERWVFEELQVRARGPFAVLRSRQKEFERELQPYFAMIDGMVQDRPYVLEVPTVADFGLYGSLSPWWTVGRTTPRTYPHLASWARRIRAFGT